MRRIHAAVMLGLAMLTGCGTAATHDRIVAQPMLTPTIRELGDDQGYPPQGQCRLQTGTHYGDCGPPLDGLRVHLSGGPQAGLFMTLPASTMETRDAVMRVKSAVENPGINDQVRQRVFGQLLIRGRAVIGTPMHATWQYRGGVRRCVGTTGPYGVATCSESRSALPATTATPSASRCHSGTKTTCPHRT